MRVCASSTSATGGNAVAGETYGSFADGTARRLVLARGVEHIGVLYSHDSMVEVVALDERGVRAAASRISSIAAENGWR